MNALPLWSRWTLAIAFFVGLGLTVYFLSHGHDSMAPTLNEQGTVEANRVGQLVVAQDQAPQEARLARGETPRAGMTRAIAADMRHLIATSDLSGPLRGVQCTSRPGSRPRREPFLCAAVAGTVTYPFYGVADLRAHTLTWCKQDAVAEAGLSVPLSPRCVS
jgi:hypothetical protein